MLRLVTASWTIRIFALSLASGACVVGGGSRPTRLEAARATGDADPGGVLRTFERRSCEGEHPRPARPSPDAVWVEGSCHFDGADYRWVPGRWEARRR